MKNNQDERLSRKVTWLSFVAMVCVVMIHSHAIGTFEHPAAWCVFLQTLLMRTATNWAVPFFFVVSGFFFATNNLQKSSIGGGVLEVIGKEVADAPCPVSSVGAHRDGDFNFVGDGEQPSYASWNL